MKVREMLGHASNLIVQLKCVVRIQIVSLENCAIIVNYFIAKQKSHTTSIS